MAISDQQLEQILKESQLLGEDQLKKSLELSRSRNIPLWEAVVSLDLISDAQMGKLAADFLKVPYIYLSQVSIPVHLLQIIPEVVAKKEQIIAFEKNSQGLKVAMADPLNLEIQQFIAKKAGEKVIPYYATAKDLNEAMRLYSKELQKTFDEMLQQQVEAVEKGQAQDVPIAKIVDLLVEYAYQNKASDIHIEPAEQQSLVRFRIDGVLHDVLKMPIALHSQVVTRVKVLSKLRTDEHMSAQDGKLQMSLPEEELDIRVSIVPIVDGEKIVMRLLSSRSRQFSLGDLGMNDKDLAKVKAGFKRPYGMVLSTGPTGSGKTTTIYAILKILNTRDKNIATIEDPVEYDMEGVNQIQVNPKTNLTFADGLRAILRQDPDIIFVGEVRDKETAGIATNSAMTGHLVLSTLHTNNAATTLPRLIDMGIEPFLVASTVNVIVGQRLVRQICQKCRLSQMMSLTELSKQIPKELIKKHLGDKSQLRIYQGKGCPVCHNSGYSGRIGVFEVLEVTEAIKELIAAKADADVLSKKAIQEGMSTMLEDGLQKVAHGITTIEEVLRVTKE
ncbi:MAG: Type II secretion system protein E [Candidatus Daviesbacteria bacterium GW2011_GWA1_41_61]|uniref:Type II secretion system protein E n=1 Tax=Candidatus Daviesbacteria bacterium GW2011_GWA2_40_9 TaxID=1618424 RepID=A0A0G0TZB4_9BACT|nr:MAG: type IV-A pilus assembly ATPase PilB, type IV pilus assembly protein PilB [Candidatus Daviesbacteria bacterium GW2011_GWC1_40_9]KKR82168.1 MAG: Type II secretion system protein E [Candidatus Daviesbacteria bacterium GW2011_GWA2_40_9]KKR93640.1 MAG: Type II secretion system protein E [Candidatus Daviesbacteria bacterium GW2011_GWB1_41_15]KKS14809.1 MAG: Type II secretion system protein E [Candidatus Daviesbacteria bacterium GW2011_GWA1_41_61]